MATLTSEESQRRFSTARVARLATVTSVGHPHLVPVTFAPGRANTLVTAVDHKAKRTTALSRLANIAANPAVSLLVDHYDEDWTQLWWARADGHATVLKPDVQSAAAAAEVAHLVARYEQYHNRTPSGPVVVITVVRWSGWVAEAT
jgi:PPOX class probable F420-dependent enzyme